MGAGGGGAIPYSMSLVLTDMSGSFLSANLPIFGDVKPMICDAFVS
jgi:hypothetical protein